MNIFKQARVNLDITQEEVAESLNTFQSWVSDVEKERNIPGIYWAYNLSEFYGLDFQTVAEYYRARENENQGKNKRKNR